MKQLLRSDILPIQISGAMLAESKMNNSGRLILRNILLQRANSQNQNGRVYPKPILVREAKRYMEQNVSIQNAIGELDHPDSSTVSLKHGALNVMSMNWSGNELRGDIEILIHLPNGQILEGYLKHGITIGISSRGLGSVREIAGSGAIEVQDDFELIAFDAVSTPSTHGAYMKLNESKENQQAIDEYKDALNNINNLIDEIIF